MERIIEDFHDGAGHLVGENHQKAQGTGHVDDGHGRYDLGSRLGNALQSSQGNGSHQDGQDDGSVFHRDAGVQLGDLHDGVHLGERPDAEVGHQYAEESEGDGQRPIGFTQPVFDVVHGPTGNLALIVHRTEFHGQATFRIFRGHAEESSQPHPQDGPRTACFDGGRHPDDVPGAYRGGQ